MIKIILSAAVILSALASCRHAQSLQIDDFARTLEAHRLTLGIPGLSVAVAVNGQLVFARGFGMRDAEAALPATPETLYPIGSITKTFTATLMMQLVEEGRLDLEQPVQQYVDWEVAPDVRIRHVLSHTSEGTPIGTEFQYSKRFNWLDNVVEAATKESFAKLLQDRVIAPAGLTRTVGGELTDPLLAKPYRTGGAASQLPPMGLHSSSGLTSNVLELVRYSHALDEGRLLRSTSRMYAPSAPGLPYGYGWYTQTVAGEQVVWHTSWWPDAFSGLLVKVPSRKLTFAILANTDGVVATQKGASYLQSYPFALAFLRAFVDPGARVDRNEMRDEDRLHLYQDIAAGERLLARKPANPFLRFDLGLAYRDTQPEKAFALFEALVNETATLPPWMTAWSHYLAAEHLASSDPARARALAERAKATGVDTDGLQQKIAALLSRL